MLVWILVILVLYLLYQKVVKPWNYWKEQGIVCERGWPIVGILSGFVLRKKHFIRTFDDVFRRHSNERYVGMNVFTNPTLFVFDPELIKLIGVKDFDHFQDHSGLSDTSPEALLSKTLIALKGQQWRHMRATLSPAFTSSKMKMMYAFMDRCARNFARHYDQPVVLEMKEVFTKYTNDVIASTAFGIETDSLNEPNNEFYQMGTKITSVTPAQALRRIFVQFLPKLAAIFGMKVFSPEVDEFFLGLLKDTIRQRKEKGIVRPDMVHLLMLAQKGKLKHDEVPSLSGAKENAPSTNDDGFATVEESHIGRQEVEAKLDDEALAAQAMIFFFAGFDTVATASCFLAHELAVHPEIQARLQHEIDCAIEKHDSDVPYDALLKMKYLDQVVSETLRLWPPGFQTDRLCIKDYTIQPVRPGEKPLVLKKGISVTIPIYSLHRDPRYFPDPERFDPERFSDENKDKIIPGTYMPFGVGPRNCIGSRFALLEIKTLFFHILTKFDIVVVDKTEVPLKLSPKTFVMKPKDGFWLGLSPRTEFEAASY